MFPGTLEKMLDIYEGPVFALKWHKGGDMLLTGSADLETHLVDARTWRIKQSWSFHKGQCCCGCCSCACQLSGVVGISRANGQCVSQSLCAGLLLPSSATAGQ